MCYPKEVFLPTELAVPFAGGIILDSDVTSLPMAFNLASKAEAADLLASFFEVPDPIALTLPTLAIISKFLWWG